MAGLALVKSDWSDWERVGKSSRTVRRSMMDAALEEGSDSSEDVFANGIE